MATKSDWADIDDAGYWHKPEAEDDDSNKAVVTDEDIKPEPKPALVKLSEGQFIEPSMGYEYNKRFKVKVKVDFLDESAKNMKKVNFSLYSIYMNKTESLSHNVDGYENDGYAEADMTLYYSPSYDEDKDKNVKYFFKATHERGEKVLNSETLDMPQETHFVELKKDDYDESGAQKYNKQQEGDTFKSNNVVKELQGNLITMGFLETGTDDGYFGDGTDAAIREFQDYAIKSDRMKRKVGKTEKAEKVLDQQASDGIVGKKTADEIDTWLRKDWVKPVPTYRHGEYDDKGVSNGKGAKGTDDHHVGTPIVAAQEDLQKVGLYQEFLIDGWFHDHLYEAVKQFQETAKDGKFLINDVLTDIGEKLTGHRQGILCPKTQKFLKAVVEKKGKVPGEELISLEMLNAADTHGTDDYHNTILPFLNKFAKIYSVNTSERIAHFLSQVGHESGFKAKTENLNYKKDRMKQIFGCQKDGWDGHDCPSEKRIHLKLWEHPEKYAENPVALANYVYANRMGNGDEANGDGYKYRGRGLIQLTGKANYSEITKIHNSKNTSDPQDFIMNPDLISDNIKYAIESAFIWWNNNNVNSLCSGHSDDDVKAVTLKVNGGENGLDDRKRIFHQIMSLM